MIDIYLPIADLRVDLFFILAIGLATGILSGLFGLGGGLISVPMLTLLGIPPQTAVITATNQMTAGTLSACIAYARRKKVDFKLGLNLLAGGIFGNFLGILTFEYLQKIGKIDSFISISFFILLIIVSTRSILELYKDYLKRQPNYVKPKRTRRYVISYLPWQTTYLSIRHEVSILLPLFIGTMGGFLVVMLGIGGGFIMIPAMLFIFKINEQFISGTVQFQVIFTSIIATLLHSFHFQQIDIVLALILIIGTVIGAQIGARIGLKINPKRFKSLLLGIILMTAASVGKKLFSITFEHPQIISEFFAHRFFQDDIANIYIFSERCNIIIYDAINTHPTLYTLCGVLMALAFGGLAGALFSKKSKPISDTP